MGAAVPGGVLPRLCSVAVPILRRRPPNATPCPRLRPARNAQPAANQTLSRHPHVLNRPSAKRSSRRPRRRSAQHMPSRRPQVLSRRPWLRPAPAYAQSPPPNAQPPSPAASCSRNAQPPPAKRSATARQTLIRPSAKRSAAVLGGVLLPQCPAAIPICSAAVPGGVLPSICSAAVLGGASANLVPSMAQGPIFPTCFDCTQEPACQPENESAKAGFVNCVAAI
jgi:hypothetical protein